MSIVTLLTDFGTVDEYAGVMKGVILSINPAANIVDISHAVDPQDILQAAYLINSAYSFFPAKTIHVIVVDPGVGSNRAVLALEKEAHIFIAPDNGVLTLLIDAGNVDSVSRVTNRKFFLNTVSPTFHGRDIFAPVAAHLSMGIKVSETGPTVDQHDIVRLPICKPSVTHTGEISGHIISIDRFGNLITDIGLSMLKKNWVRGQEENMIVTIGDTELRGVKHSYGNVPAGNPLAIIGSRGFLEIAVNIGSAELFFNVKRGDTVRVKMP